MIGHHTIRQAVAVVVAAVAAAPAALVRDAQSLGC